MTPRFLPGGALALAVALTPVGATALALSVSTAAAPVAAAHSALLSVDPADGATVSRAPGRLTLTFNEDVNPNFATITLVDAGRQNRVTADPTVSGREVSVPVGAVDAGEYTVGYRITSADGHVVQGSTRFTVAGATSAPTGESSSATAAAAAAEPTDDEGGQMIAVVATLGVLSAALIFAAWLLTRRHRSAG